MLELLILHQPLPGKILIMRHVPGMDHEDKIIRPRNIITLLYKRTGLHGGFEFIQGTGMPLLQDDVDDTHNPDAEDGRRDDRNIRFDHPVFTKPRKTPLHRRRAKSYDLSQLLGRQPVVLLHLFKQLSIELIQFRHFFAQFNDQIIKKKPLIALLSANYPEGYGYFCLYKNYRMSNAFSPEELSAFRNDTTGCAHVIHLNNAGAALMPDPVTRAIQEHIALEARIGGYEAAAECEKAIAQFYVQAAKLLHCTPENIAFTNNATDSFIRALSSIPFQPGDVILTDNDNYISNQLQFLSLQKRQGLRLLRIKNAPIGGIDLTDLEEQLYRLKPRLLAITHIPTNSGH